MWQRKEIPERPNKIRALREIRLYVSSADRRIQFENAVAKFVDPHVQPTWERRPLRLHFQKWNIIAPKLEHWEAIFFIRGENLLMEKAE